MSHYFVSDLCAGYGNRVFIKNLSLQISSGELHFILGANGAGKSTLLKALARHDLNISGEVSLPEKVSYLPPKPSVQPGVTGHDVCELLRVEKSPWVFSGDPFNVVPLLKQSLHELSSGEAQRVLLHALLCQNTDMVLLDEPLTYLDVSYQFKMKSVLLEQQNRGRCFVISTHDLVWACSFADARAVFLTKGQVLAQGKLSELIAHSKVQLELDFQSTLLTNPLNGDKLLALAQRETP